MSTAQYLWGIAVTVGGAIVVSIFKVFSKWYSSSTKIVLILTPCGRLGSKGIYVQATWRSGRPTTFHDLVIVRYKKIGKAPHSMHDTTTIGPDNLTHCFDMGVNLHPYPIDDLIGIGMQDERGRWHYSERFPWIERNFWLPSRIYRYNEWRRMRKLLKGKIR